jgi:hypothetical protein
MDSTGAWAPHTATHGLEGADISTVCPGLVNDPHGAHVVDACRRGTVCAAGSGANTAGPGSRPTSLSSVRPREVASACRACISGLT